MNIMASVIAFDDFFLSAVCDNDGNESKSCCILVVVVFWKVVTRDFNVVFSTSTVGFTRIRDIVGIVKSVRCVVSEIDKNKTFIRDACF
jgi:hypothetical protein